MSKLNLLFIIAFGLSSTVALACGGDKDKDKEGPRDGRDLSAVYCGGDKDKDKDKDRS